MRNTKIRMYFLFSLAIVVIYSALVLQHNVGREYLWLLLPGLLLTVLGYLAYRQFIQEKTLSKLRGSWGKEQPQRTRDFASISSLFNCAPQAENTIDDRTWHDLNMDLIFAKMDCTLTSFGQQTLYRLLRLPVPAHGKVLQKRKDVIETFQKQGGLREHVQLALARIDARLGSGLPLLLWGKPDIKPVHPLILYKGMFVLALLSPLSLLLGPRVVLLLLVVFQINMYLHFKVQKGIKSHFEAVRSLGQLISAGKRLGSISCSNCPALAEKLETLRSLHKEVAQFRRITRNVGVESTDPMLNAGLQYVTILFLTEVRGFYRALRFIEDKREELQDFLLVLGEIDVLQSVASYRESLRDFCVPKFTEQVRMSVQELYHPLVENPVSNTVFLEGKSRGLLVTGSNMSGKSTFLRAVGLNALLAQTVATCHATAYESCSVHLLTCIGRADNVVEGKSYYLEEALGIRRVLNSLNNEVVTLAIFDEMFRGTNSEERIAAGYRVLKFIIERNAIVLVATHDLELTDMLAGRYTNSHFTDRVGSLGLEFDFKLKKGPATTKNAIALLRHLKYPREITDPVNSKPNYDDVHK